MSLMTHPVTLEAVREARARIADVVHRTPVMTCQTLDHMAGRSLFLKCENLQKMGAFKMRGALNAVRKLPDDVARRGVVTHSSGNHAQALALSAKLRGIPAHIVMPRTAPAVKKRAVEGYGGKVVECEPTIAARNAAAAKVQAETGATLIHPYDHADVIAGQGTIALELLEQAPDLDAIVVPISGGGLISGITIAAKALRPSIKIIGVEPSGADDAARSLAAGSIVRLEAPKSIADGLLASLGELTWPIVRDMVDEIVTVSEEQIIAAMKLLWERQKIVVEPSGSVPLAAVLNHKLPAAGKRIALILSGGNVDLDHLPWIPR